MGYKGEIPATHYGTTDVRLDRGPGVVYWIVIRSDADDWKLIIRDGPDTSAERLVGFSQRAEVTRLFKFNPPLPYKKGLFIDVGIDVQSFTIAYDHLEPKVGP